MFSWFQREQGQGHLAHVSILPWFIEPSAQTYTSFSDDLDNENKGYGVMRRKYAKS
jgi:hypothetical protein